MVPQTGPRMLKSNKRIASALNLTSDHELEKSKEAYEEKLRKEYRKQEAALNKGKQSGEEQATLFILF